MNERIKELAEQAGVFEGVFTKHGGVPCDLKGYGMLEAEMAKFAELIVRECAEVAVFKDSGTVATANVAGYMAAGRSIAASLIKEHFGVT